MNTGFFLGGGHKYGDFIAMEFVPYIVSVIFRCLWSSTHASQPILWTPPCRLEFLNNEYWLSVSAHTVTVMLIRRVNSSVEKQDETNHQSYNFVWILAGDLNAIYFSDFITSTNKAFANTQSIRKYHFLLMNIKIYYMEIRYCMVTVRDLFEFTTGTAGSKSVCSLITLTCHSQHTYTTRWRQDNVLVF